MEDQSRPSPFRPSRRSPWLTQALSWSAPERSFTCCGVEFRAMTAESLLLMRDAHQKAHRA